MSTTLPRRKLSEIVGERLDAARDRAVALAPDDTVWREVIDQWRRDVEHDGRLVLEYEVDRDGRGHIKLNSLKLRPIVRSHSGGTEPLRAGRDDQGWVRVRHLLDEQGHPIDTVGDARFLLAANGIGIPADLARLDATTSLAPTEDTPDVD